MVYRFNTLIAAMMGKMAMIRSPFLEKFIFYDLLTHFVSKFSLAYLKCWIIKAPLAYRTAFGRRNHY